MPVSILLKRFSNFLFSQQNTAKAVFEQAKANWKLVKI
jgi:hypothetical protein